MKFNVGDIVCIVDDETKQLYEITSIDYRSFWPFRLVKVDESDGYRYEDEPDIELVFSSL